METGSGEIQGLYFCSKSKHVSVTPHHSDRSHGAKEWRCRSGHGIWTGSQKRGLLPTGNIKKGTANRTDEKQFEWLRQLLEWQQNLKDPAEFLETVRMDLFPDEVYVFTPRGDVKAFPRGATPIDFAYSIHSEVGEKCMGARVNGRMVPLRYQLKTGDIVEIITSPKQHPSKDWLEFVKTPRQKQKSGNG